MNRPSMTCAAVLLLIAAGTLASADPPAARPTTRPATTGPTFRPYARPVTTWVPPYAVAKSRARLAEQPGMKEALTHVGLQFWTPTKAGGVDRVRFPEAHDAAVTALRDWGHANGIRVMLCVYNAGGKDWDWPLARAAFADNRAAFVAALLAEVARWNLDGVDLDLEGGGNFEADKRDYVAFVAELSNALHARGKHLTVDTFAYKWNAPNQTWWPELLPLVDGLVTMGYDETGATAADWRSYAAAKRAAGAHAAKLQIGMPAGKPQWRGNTAAEQVRWVRDDGGVGLAVWDAQLPSPEWRDAELWRDVRAIRDGAPGASRNGEK